MFNWIGHLRNLGSEFSQRIASIAVARSTKVDSFGLWTISIGIRYNCHCWINSTELTVHWYRTRSRIRRWNGWGLDYFQGKEAFHWERQKDIISLVPPFAGQHSRAKRPVLWNTRYVRWTSAKSRSRNGIGHVSRQNARDRQTTPAGSLFNGDECSLSSIPMVRGIPRALLFVAQPDGLSAPQHVRK